MCCTRGASLARRCGTANTSAAGQQRASVVFARPCLSRLWPACTRRDVWQESCAGCFRRTGYAGPAGGGRLDGEPGSPAAGSRRCSKWRRPDETGRRIRSVDHRRAGGRSARGGRSWRSPARVLAWTVDDPAATAQLTFTGCGRRRLVVAGGRRARACGGDRGSARTGCRPHATIDIADLELSRADAGAAAPARARALVAPLVAGQCPRQHRRSRYRGAGRRTGGADRRRTGVLR